MNSVHETVQTNVNKQTEDDHTRHSISVCLP